VKAANEKGFLFLSPPDNGKDVWCHFSEFEKARIKRPEKGERIQYQIKMIEKGRQAVNVEAVL
jgi:CspA family cold shock protein